MRDNRIIKEEQLNERDKVVINEAVDIFYDQHYGEGFKERQESALRNNPNIIERDGKLYDKRYYKGK